MVKNGVEIEPETEDDYRRMHRELLNGKVEFHIFELKSEKTLKVVLRGIIHEINEDVAEDLKEKGYPTKWIVRMKGKAWPTTIELVELDKDYKSIYNLKVCCGLAITFEPLRVSTDIGYRCYWVMMAGQQFSSEITLNIVNFLGQKWQKCNRSHCSSVPNKGRKN